MDSPTAVALAKRHREIALKEVLLRRQQEFAKLNVQHRRVDELSKSIGQALCNITLAGKGISQNAAQLADILNKEEDCIAMAKDDHKVFAQLLATSTRILGQQSVITEQSKEVGVVNIDLKTSLENVEQISLNFEIIRNALEDCSHFHTKITDIMNEPSYDKGNSLPSPSESVFLNTLEANNISTSTEYGEA